MQFRLVLTFFLGFVLDLSLAQGPGRPASTSAPTSTRPTTTIASTSSSSHTPTTTSPGGGGGTITDSPGATGSTPADVYLNVPQLSVGRIELDVENLQADINLNAQVAGLVTINAGVAVSIQKVNLTITDVDAELELIVRLGNLVQIVERVFNSLDLNPLLITALNDVTGLVNTVVGAVDGLLGSITQGGTTLSFIVDNLGNIVQEVAGATGNVSSIVGNYLTNMTFTGATEQLANGLVQKTYSYSPLSALVNIVFNTLGQVVQATVVKKTGTGGGTSTSTTITSSSGATASASLSAR
jgi:hypothetical protein